MKVKYLIKELKECQKKYGDDFLEWGVYLEQMGFWKKGDKPINNFKKEVSNWKDYDPISDSDDWLYLRGEGSGEEAWCGKWPNKKAFMIQVNF